MELTNAAGCLTDAGLRAVAEAPPGGAPADLAAHLSACPRCQRGLLGVDRRPAPARRPPSAARLTLLLLGVLLALAALLWTTRLLVG